MKTIQKIALSTLLTFAMNTQVNAAGDLIAEVDTGTSTLSAKLSNVATLQKIGAGQLNLESTDTDASSIATLEISGGKIQVNEKGLGGAQLIKFDTASGNELILKDSTFAGDSLPAVTVASGSGNAAINNFVALLTVQAGTVTDGVDSGGKMNFAGAVTNTGTNAANNTLAFGSHVYSAAPATGDYVELTANLASSDIKLQVGKAAVAHANAILDLDGITVLTPEVLAQDAVKGHLLVGNAGKATPAGKVLQVASGALEVKGDAPAGSVASLVDVASGAMLMIDSTGSDRVIGSGGTDPFKDGETGSVKFNSGAILKLGDKINYARPINVGVAG